MMRLDSAAGTKGGNNHERNEDAVYHLSQPNPAGSDVGLYIVCDGMGGQEAGDQASKLALKAAVGVLAEPLLVQYPAGEDRTWQEPLYNAVQAANRAVWQAAQETPGKMGSTIVVAAVVDGMAYVGAVGDSRAYACRQGQVQQITRDHSIAAALAESNQIREDEVAGHPRGNLLWRALGQQETVDIDLFRWPLQDGDRLLLCSDGLWKPLADPAVLAARLNRADTAGEIAEQMVDDAIQLYGEDDASAVVVLMRAMGVQSVPVDAAAAAEEEAPLPVMDAVPA